MKIKYNFRGSQARLDKYLSRQFKDVSRNFVQRLILGGKIKVNGSAIKDKNYRLSDGDEIEADYQAPRPLSSPEIRLKKVYEDDYIIVIDKPAGLLVHPTPSQNRPSVAGALLAQVKGIAGVGENRFRPGIVHRLDADTSGLLVVAKNQKAFEFLKAAFQSRKVVKKYSALLHGRLSASHGFIDKPVGRRTGEGKMRAGIGRPALTEYWVK
ncbi:MAG: pseudouridine synthase, partial [Patescibacteria group bacterium]